MMNKMRKHGTKKIAVAMRNEEADHAASLVATQTADAPMAMNAARSVAAPHLTFATGEP
jgi:hypothetical protein